MEHSSTSLTGRKRKFADMSSDEEDSQPAISLRYFAGASSGSESPPPFGLGDKNYSQMNGAMRSATPATSHVAPGSAKGGSSFAARMMAKMGYVEGQGLGSSGQGIVNPIEAQARPQGAGLGAVKEKSKQAREEERRAAIQRGEVIEDSSEEEHKARRRTREARQRSSRSGTSTPISRAKFKFRTVREIEADMEGLNVPSVLKSLIDVTGKEQRILTSTAGLMAPQAFVSDGESEALKIAQRARHDLEAFADEWKGLTERKSFIDLEEDQIIQELDTCGAQADQIAKLITDVSNLEILQDGSLTAQFDEVTNKLEALGSKYRDAFDEYRLSDAVIAAIHPIFRKLMEEWEPLKEPSLFVSNLRRLQPFLPQKDSKKPFKRQSTSPYETMMHTLWFPCIRSALVNEWKTADPTPATSLIVSWKDVLPAFVYTNVLDQAIVPKLTADLSKWKPRGSNRHHSSSQQKSRFPWWLFPWLQYLDERHTDPKQATGLLSDAKRKFRVALDVWDLRQGLISGIELWRDALGSEFDVSLRNHLLPRLASHLREDLEINPQDQDLRVLEDVLKWRGFFRPNVFGLLLVADFFPKWHSILYIWLTNDPNYEEVGEWFSWWRQQIPPEINELTIIDDEWKKGLQTMDLASRLGERAVAELPPPAEAAASRAIPQEAATGIPQAAVRAPEKVPRAPRAIKEIAFKDILEQWCLDQGLIILPLREAHPLNGQPLFRITASATGKGGAVVFIERDVVWVQNKKMKEVWDPMGLEDRLVERAEGR